MNKQCIISDSDKSKKLVSIGYNYVFNKKSGLFIRWGRTADEDPQISPFGPEILDIEVSTICHRSCKFCYKSNTSSGINMSLDMLKKIIDKISKPLTQVAIGIGDISGNTDLFRMMEYCRSKGVIPNITINGDGLTNEYAKELVSLCGAIAVSYYGNNDTCFNAVRKLIDAGAQQVNIHTILSEDTYGDCLNLIIGHKNNHRTKGLNAIVFLMLKPKGSRNNLKPLKRFGLFESMVDMAFRNKVPIGFDSCGACAFLKAIRNRDDYNKLKDMVEPCESSLFSYYISAEGKGYPCSFCEGEPGFEGIDVANCEDFIKEVWYADSTIKFRENLLKNNRECPVFDLGMEE